MYQKTDEFRKKLKTLIRREFNRLSLLSFDELNPVRVQKETKELFERLLKFNHDGYLEVIESARLYALSLLPKEMREKEERIDSEDFLEYVLTSYNPVTGYLYEKEAERKRLRMSEEMSTARHFLDRKKYSVVVNKSANLWYTQSGQYSIDVEDATVISVWKSCGVKRVMWISEHDDRTCGVCSDLDRNVFDIDNVPEKQHYNCRCTLVPVIEK